MKLTNYALVNIMNTLSNFESKKLPQRISYAITRNLVVISREYQIYNKQLEKLLAEYKPYVVHDEEGKEKTSENGLPLIKEEKRAEFSEKVKDLLNIEIDCDIYQIDSELFDYDDGDKYDSLSPQEIFVLQSIICKED